MVVGNDCIHFQSLYQQLIVIWREIKIYIIINHSPSTLSSRLSNKCFTRIELGTKSFELNLQSKLIMYRYKSF